jgi:hypothetical protein
VSQTLQAFAFGGFSAQDYTRFDSNGSGSRFGINGADTMVGTPSSTIGSFVGTPPADFHPLTIPGFNRNVAWGISNNGDLAGVVGNVPPFPVDPHGFMLRDGELTLLDAPGFGWTSPEGINDSGQVVGSVVTRVPPP